MDTLTLLALVLAAAAAAGPILIHRAFRAPRTRSPQTPDALGLPYRAVHVPTAHQRHLSGWLVPAAGDAPCAPAVVAMHGWGGNAGDMLPLAVHLRAAGYPVLLLDARNHGASDRDGHSSLPRFAEDLEHGVEWLAGQPGIDRRRITLIGHSVGAGAALLAAARCRDIAAVISIAAFAHPQALMQRELRRAGIPYRSLGWLVLQYVQWVIGAQFDTIAPCNTIRRVSCPVLLVHGTDDSRVPTDDARRLHRDGPVGGTELLLIDGAGHDPSGALDRHAGALTDFLDRRVSGDPAGRLGTGPATVNMKQTS